MFKRSSEKRQSHSKARIIAMISAVALLASILVLATVACGDQDGSGGSDTATIIGAWEDSATGDTFEFTADGRFVSAETEGLNMTYEVMGNEITFSSDYGSGITVEFTLDGDTLKIEDYETGEFQAAKRVN